MPFLTNSLKRVYYHKILGMRRRNENISVGDFFDEEALTSFYSIVHKTIRDYVDEITRYARYKSVVSQTVDGSILDNRGRLIDLYDSCYIQDAHLQGVLETLYSYMIGERYSLGRYIKGKMVRDEESSKILEGSQFEKIVKEIIDSHLWGYSCVEILNETDPSTGRLKEVNSIERRNVLANQRRIVKRQGVWYPGWNIDDDKYRHNYLLFNTGGLGIFSATTPLILAKKFTVANWVNFAQTYGQPIIHGKTGSEDVGSRTRMARSISNAAQKRVIVTGKEDEVDIKTFTMSNSEQIYDGLKNHTNTEVSNIILGSQSMAGAQQAYVGSAKSHADILRARIKRYRRFVTNAVNEQVLPLLKYWDLIPQDVWFFYNNHIDMSTEEKIKLYDVLTNKYQISSDVIEREFGIVVGEQLNLMGGSSGGSVNLDDDGEPGVRRMSDEEYRKRYGHDRPSARVNFLRGV